jgi:hypothetical protein
MKQRYTKTNINTATKSGAMFGAVCAMTDALNATRRSNHLYRWNWLFRTGPIKLNDFTLIKLRGFNIYGFLHSKVLEDARRS